MSEKYSIPDWWGEYRSILSKKSGAASHARLIEITNSLIEQGIILPGRPMPRRGAEGLAIECDDLIQKSVKSYALMTDQRYAIGE